MPYSARENEEDVLKFVQDNNILNVLDIGAGSGTYGLLLREHVNSIHAIEVWKPYIEEFSLDVIYDSVRNIDVREWGHSVMREKNPIWDMIIFGDILEHMTAEEAQMVWNYASEASRYGMISVPIIHYPQGAEFGNPFEVHVQEHMHPEDIRRDYGPFVFDREYEVTGTFIKEF